MNPTHLALRDATASAHERVDAVYGGFALDTPSGYAAFLAAQAEAFLPLEAALDDAAPAIVDDWPDRRRAQRLRADLTELGIAHPEAEPLPPLSPHAAAGTLYVLEGSRLGGRFLARGLRPASPRRFLDAGYPTGNWPKLLDTLDALLRPPPALDEAVAAARAAFAMFEQSGHCWRSKG